MTRRLATLAALLFAAASLSPAAGPAAAGTRANGRPTTSTTHGPASTLPSLRSRPSARASTSPSTARSTPSPWCSTTRLYVATENDSGTHWTRLTGAVKWRTSLGFPVRGRACRAATSTARHHRHAGHRQRQRHDLRSRRGEHHRGVVHELVALSTVDGGVKWRRSPRQRHGPQAAPAAGRPRVGEMDGCTSPTAAGGGLWAVQSARSSRRTPTHRTAARVAGADDARGRYLGAGGRRWTPLATSMFDRQRRADPDPTTRATRHQALAVAHRARPTSRRRRGRRQCNDLDLGRPGRRCC